MFDFTEFIGIILFLVLGMGVLDSLSPIRIPILTIGSIIAVVITGISLEPFVEGLF